MENSELSIVAQWNELQLEAVREGGASPTPTTYQLHLASAAVYDTYAALSPDASGHYSEIETALENTQANKAEAISYAAYTVLSQLYPEKEADFAAFLEELGFDPSNSSNDPDTAAGLGRLAVQRVFEARENDGSNAENGFADTTDYQPVNESDPTSDRAPGGESFDPNQWQPLRVPNGTLTDENGVPIFDNDNPSTFNDQQALTPHWGEVDSFALASGDQFRPPTPPQLGDTSEYVDGLGNVTTNDQAYRDQINEVIEFSAELTNEQKVVAEYWADGPRTESPPGHWNQIAQDLSLREGHGIDEDAEMFFAMNAAVFDAGIATWEAKYEYNYVRPQSAIRNLFFDQEIQAWGGPDQGTQTILGQQWQPYQNVTFVTPPFPEFVSGHSTFSMAAARTLASYLGTDAFYDGETLSNYDLDGVEGTDLLGQFVTSELIFEEFGDGPPVVLQWETLTEAAEEAGISRLYGGIHIQDGNLRGLEIGESVAANAEQRWSALFSNGGDDFILTDAEGGLTLGGDGNDSIFGGDGNDQIEAGAGNDLTGGGAGNDVMNGGHGDDMMGGGTGNDTLDGGDGNDIIGAGQGDDSATGGEGDDIVNGGHGNDDIDGGAGLDTIGGGTGDDVIADEAGNDDIGGGAGQDVIDAGDGDDSVGGGEGNDDILGGDGNDFLAGGGRDDTIDGGAGDDSINGGDGDDVMTGGAGADVFVFNVFKAGDEDVITDFEDGVDSFLIRTTNLETGEVNIDNGGNGLQGFLDALGISDTDAGAQMNVDGHSVLIADAAASDLTLEDFQFI
ncbi:DUF6851 domain-containing protein [uncultured Roseovarius sp.]|uniref:DUF6851 domain-containing protein n=1 Tax=uncultured Roseovarius sp. TaxID=293344 RepID=UPI0026285644|nr:phosphatase PAP2 family protein [uncultured Roseovarius sp.]